MYITSALITTSLKQVNCVAIYTQRSHSKF